MIYKKLNSFIDHVLLYCISRMMMILSRGRVDKVSADESLRSLLPTWNKLISERFCKDDPQLLESLRALVMSQLSSDAQILIPSLKKRKTPVMNTWDYQNEIMEWDIAPNELVLDIGSGGWPLRRANHLADRYPKQTTHRMNELVLDERPFLVVDLEHLPFANQAYDYIFCSHVLEHLNDPGQAMRELMRAGRKGYIEVPTRLSDVIFNFTRLPDHHRWHGMLLNDTLVLVEWNDWEHRDLGNHFFDALHSEYANAFQDFFEDNRDLFFVSLHWNKAIDFLIIDKRGRILDSSRCRA